jgi:DNA-binding NarL/FixJ family response regulator
VPGSSRRGGNSDESRGVQAGTLKALLASVHSHIIQVANDDTMMPLPRIDEVANDSRMMPPEVRALLLRLGREELVIISMEAWEHPIVRKLSRLQRKVIRLLLLGMTHHQTADELEIRPQTVANSTSALYQREDGLADTLEQLASILCTPLFDIKLQ